MKLRLHSLIALTIALLSGQSRAASGGADGFGYTWFDSAEPNGVEYSWIDIQETGQQLPVTTTPGATINLETPFVLYGDVVNSLVVSRHGYLSTSLSDPGDDSTPDCPLPASPDSGGGHRLYPLHGKYAESAKVYYQYIPEDAHPANRCGAHVITWSNMVEANHGNSPAQFQVLLFDNFDIIYQFDTDTGLRGRFTTTGLQRNGSATDFHTIACDDDNTIYDELAVRILPPRIGVNSAADTTGGPGISLRDALDSARDGTRIQVSVTGILTPTQPTPLLASKSVAIELSEGEGFFTIDSGGTGTGLTVLDVFQANHCFISGLSFRNAERGINTTESLLLHDCQISSNSGSDPGAGVFANGSLYLSGGRITNNTSSDDGGGISAARVSAWGTHFEDNETVSGTDNGGAVYIRSGTGTSTFKDCTFETNEAGGRGSGIWAGGDHVVIAEDCFFDRNTLGSSSGSRGAGMAMEDASLTARRCLFVGNEGGSRGGGVYASGDQRQRFEHCSFDGNFARSGGRGGAIAQFGGRLELYHCSIVRNTHDAIFLTGSFYDFTSGNCLFENNEALAGGETAININAATFTSLGNNLCDEDEAVFSAADGDLENTNALIHNTKIGGVLRAGSPAIDAGGTPQADSDTDFRGHPRQFGPKIDIGAYEYHGAAVVDTAEDILTGSIIPEAAPAGSPISLRQALDRVGEGGTVTFDPSLSGAEIDFTALMISSCEVHIDASSLSQRPIFTTMDLAASLTIQDKSSVTGVDFTQFGAWPLRINGGATITDCDFYDNSRVIETQDNDSGGTQTLRLERCRIYDNGPSTVASSHPFFVGGSVRFQLIDSVIENTTVDGDGGGIYFNGRLDADIENSSIVRNTCTGDGGAIFIRAAAKTNMRITNSTISSNIAGGQGGGIEASDASFTIAHSTIAANECAFGTCAIATSGTSAIDITHCIFQGNGQGFNTSNFGNVATSSGHNIIDNDDLNIPQSTDMVNRKAHIAPLGYYSDDGDYLMPVHALLAISPAIDSGQVGIDIIGDPPSLDQRKANRIRNGTGSGTLAIDIGAFEAGTPLFVTNTNNTGAGSLRDTIDVAAANPAGRVLFDPSLNGQQTTVTSQIIIPGSVQIDATALPDGYNVSGGTTTRAFRMNTNGHLAMHALDIRNCAGAGNNGSGYRQAGGHSVFSNCAFFGSSGNRGAGLYIENGTSYLLNCSIANNTVTSFGGAITFLSGTRGRIEHCTISNNVSGSRGCVFVADADVVSKYTIYVRNTVSNDAILDSFGWDSGFDRSAFSLGNNYSDESGVSAFLSQPTDSLGNTTPPLGGIADNGGWCWSALPIAPGSIDNAVSVNDSKPYPSFDSRGFTRRAGATLRMDFGATELNGDTNDEDDDGMPDWWECLHGLVVFSPNTLEAGQNLDGDDFTNLEEFQNGTNPRVIDSPSELPEFTEIVVISDTSIRITLSGLPNRTYMIENSFDLENWSPQFSVTLNGSGETSFSVNYELTGEATFFRVRLP